MDLDEALSIIQQEEEHVSLAWTGRASSSSWMLMDLSIARHRKSWRSHIREIRPSLYSDYISAKPLRQKMIKSRRDRKTKVDKAVGY